MKHHRPIIFQAPTYETKGTPTFLSGQLCDYRTMTAKIRCRLPDHPALLQTYVRQELDPVAHYPTLQ